MKNFYRVSLTQQRTLYSIVYAPNEETAKKIILEEKNNFDTELEDISVNATLLNTIKCNRYEVVLIADPTQEEAKFNRNYLSMFLKYLDEKEKKG